MSYSEWIDARRIEYADAISEAYSNKDEPVVEGSFSWAWSEMLADSDVNSLLPSNTAFWNTGGPTAEEDDIIAFGTFISGRPDVAGALNLAYQVIVDTGAQTELDTQTIVGGQYRQWKGQKVYTYPNGIIIGKNSKLIASFGAQVGSITDSIGDDTLIYFDGIRGSKGTQTAGTVVFNGDMVCSGSIQGAGGVIVIDDVIQLETGVPSPAGIAVDDEGKILLRHRGMGFLDFIDEDERMKDEAINEGKVWMGTQNTNSARYGTTLIPNGNFSLVTAESDNGTVVEFPSGVATIGATSRSIEFSQYGDPPQTDYGVVRFDGSGGTGILMPAVPIEAERYIINVRFKTEVTEIDTTNVPPEFGENFGAYIFFHETTDSSLGTTGDAQHVWHSTSANVAGTVSIESGINPHDSNTSEQWINYDGATDLGSPLGIEYQVLTFTYEPTELTKFASFGFYVKNVNENVYLDYVVMTAKPPLASEIAEDIAAVETGITNETGSKVPGAAFPNLDLWTAWPVGSQTLALDDNGGDGSPATPDSSAKITMDSSIVGDYAGLLSAAVPRDSDKYLVGARLKSDIPCTVEIWVIEETAGQFNAFSTDHYVALVGSNEVSITTVAGTGALNDPDSGDVDHDLNADEWTNLYGTYIPTGFGGTLTSSDLPTSDVSRFSILINIKTPDAVVDVDYVWCSEQTASGDLAAALADYAYGTAEAFVTDMNDLLTKESGSLITNASMAMLSPNPDDPTSMIPSGYRVYDGSMSLEENLSTSDRAILVSVGAGDFCRLYSPPFRIDSNASDKYSIGVRMKKHSTTVTVEMCVVWSTEVLGDGEVTLHYDSQSPLSGDTLSTSNIEVFTLDPDSDQGGITTFDVSLTEAEYENWLATFDVPEGARTAAVSITTTGDTVFDYILVKEQVCSFDLAEETAEAKRDEAIAQATGALQGLTNSLNQEQGSLLANSTFAAYIYEDPIQKPKNWAMTRSDGTFKRVVNSTESGGSIDVPGEYIPSPPLGMLGGGSIITHTGTSDIGLLSSYFSLPMTVGVGETTVGSESYSPTGRYMVAIQLKTIKASHTSGLKILAHECASIPTSSFILVTDESSYATGYSGDELVHDGDTITTQEIALITLSDPLDETPGESDDEHREQWTDTVWNSIGGTYTPSDGMRYVSFEFIFETNKSGQEHAIDYITMTPQSVDADFADTLAQARAEDAIDNIEDEPTQIGNVIANPYFASAVKRTRANERPKKWYPMRATSSLSDQPSFSTMSFYNDTLKKGLILSEFSGSGYTYKGIMSTPFRTVHPDYEIVIKAKITSGTISQTNIPLLVYAYEVNSDIDEDIVQVISTHQYSIPADVEWVENDNSPVACTAYSSNEDYLIPVPGDEYFRIFKFEYKPTDTARYASLRIYASGLQSVADLHISYVKCVRDTPYKLLDRSITGIFGAGNNSLADMLGTPSLALTGPMGIASLTEVKNSAVLGAGIGDFSQWGSRVDGVTKTHKFDPYKEYIFNGDFKIVTHDGASLHSDHGGASDGVYPAGMYFGCTNWSLHPNDTDGETGKEIGGSRHHAYSDNYAYQTTEKSGGYNGFQDQDFIDDVSDGSIVVPDWYYPKVNYDPDGNFINLAAFGHGVTFGMTKIPGGIRVRVSLEAKCGVRTTGAIRMKFYIGDDDNATYGTQSTTSEWLPLPNELEAALTICIAGRTTEDTNDFFVPTTGNGECPSNTSATTSATSSSRYVVQKSVVVDSTSWKTYTQTFDLPEDFQMGSISIGRKANFNSTELLGAYNGPTSGNTGWQVGYYNGTAEWAQNYSGNGSTGTLWARHAESYYDTFLDAINDDSELAMINYNANKPRAGGWDWKEMNSAMIRWGSGIQWQNVYRTNNSTGLIDAVGINSNANYISIRNVSAKETLGITLSLINARMTVEADYASLAGFLNLGDSDSRLKENIEDAPEALPILNQFEVKRFHWKPKFEEERPIIDLHEKSWGIIAQDVIDVLPSAVNQRKYSFGHMYNINNSELVALAMKAIQEQQVMITSQQEQINELKQLVQQLIDTDSETPEE